MLCLPNDKSIQDNIVSSVDDSSFEYKVYEERAPQENCDIETKQIAIKSDCFNTLFPECRKDR